jgi:hypothetical protein
MPRYPQGGGGQIDMSGIAGLGDFGQNALGMVLAQQQQDAQMNLARRAQAAEEANAAAQNEIRRQIAQQEQQQAEEQKNAQRQGKIMQLAQVSKDGESFEKVAQYLLPDLTPLERDFGRTFADETSRVKREEKKAAEEKEEQARNRGFLSQGGLDAFMAVPPDQRADAIAQRAPKYGMDPADLAFQVQGREEQLRRRDAERAEAAARSGGSGRMSVDELIYRDAAKEEAKAERKREALAGNDDYRRARRRGASDRLAGKFAGGKPGIFADPMILDIPREGGVEAQNKLAGTVQAMDLLTDLRALTEVVAEHGKGGVGSETIADVGRRTGNPAAFASAFSAARSAVISLQAKARSGLQLNETELRFLDEALPLLSETVLQDGKLAKGVEARLRVTERELESGYWAGTEPRISRSNGRALRKLLHKQKTRRKAHWQHFLSTANTPSFDEIDGELD